MSDMNDNEQVVVALFPDRATADETVENLKQWDKAQSDVALGTIGLLYVENGEIKSDVPHKVGRGATVGVIIGVVAGVLAGPIGLLGGALAGGLLGGGVGAFFKQSLHLTEDEIAALGKELESGKVALVVNCDDFEVTATESILQYHGGVVKSYVVPTDAVSVAADTMDKPAE